MSRSNQLTKDIIRLVEKSGGAARRVNTLGVMRNGRYTKSGMRRGFEDVDAVIPLRIGKQTIGLKVAIEVKIGKDRQSKEQKIRQREVEEAGGIYLVAKNLEDFITDLQRSINQKIQWN